MPITLDSITRKQLILVRQLYQRALLQAEVRHSYVDKILALIGFDFTNESVLKAVVCALDDSKSLSNNFPGIIQQADNLLTAAGLPPVPNKRTINHVHALRNDAQHKAKYPNDNDVSDCRTYTRDFLQRIIFNVWGQEFESLTLTDLIQNAEVKKYLTDAAAEFAKGKHLEAIIKTEAAFSTALGRIKDVIAEPVRARSVMISEGYGKTKESGQILDAIDEMRNIIIRSVIGLDFRSWRRYEKAVSSVRLCFFGDGKYSAAIIGAAPVKNDVAYALEFATNACHSD
jgi:hypothetical protein